jgi:hypothetical protein
MKHDPKQFGTATDSRAGWYLRAQLQRRREARQAALIAGGLALVFAAATAAAMHYGKEGAAALLGIVTALLWLIASAANSEA